MEDFFKDKESIVDSDDAAPDNNLTSDGLSAETDTDMPNKEPHEVESYDSQPTPTLSEDAPYNQPEPQNRIEFSDIKVIDDYRPMSRGLKLFALIMAAVMLLTAASTAGYFLGRNSAGVSLNKNVTLDLAAKPKDTDEMTAAEVYQKVNPSVVGIIVYNTDGDGSRASGVFYSKDGYIITNDHIYAEIPLAKFKVYTHDGKEYDAEYVAGDQISDLAVLKIKEGKFTAAEFGNSDEAYCGENVVSIGRPDSTEKNSSITRGIVSALNRRVQTTSSYSAKLIQTDSAINPGSSGGALVNMYGQVIGITSSKHAGTSYDLVSYSIPTVTVKKIVEQLIRDGKVTSRAKLGISYSAVNTVTAEINGFKNTGLYISSVSKDSALYGKLSEGDMITAINGIKATSDDIVLDIIESKKPGDKITVTVLTAKGAEKEFEAELKANTSGSSYTTKKAQSSGSNSSESGSGGTFDFPYGE